MSAMRILPSPEITRREALADLLSTVDERVAAEVGDAIRAALEVGDAWSGVITEREARAQRYARHPLDCGTCKRDLRLCQAVRGVADRMQTLSERAITCRRALLRAADLCGRAARQGGRS